MRHLRKLSFLVSLAFVGCARADTPMVPHQYVAVSAALGDRYFTMIPLRAEREQYDGRGIAYRLNRDGSIQELWRTEGWFSFEVYLSPDGNFLVAMGPWNLLPGPNPDDVALTFYAKGQPLKTYRVLDLLRDKSKVVRSVSHYRWLARDLPENSPVLRDIEAKVGFVELYSFHPKIRC